METAQNKIVKAALLGAGTVGSGVYQLVQERQEDFSHICGTQIQITKILVRDASKEREGIPSPLLTDNWNEIIEDDSISIIIEVMGGIEPAKSYLLEAMKAGKQIVTANKDLIAEHGHELLDSAEKYGWDIFIPKFSYTTDNAAMIAITGYFKYLDKDFCSIDLPAYSRVTL